MSDYPQLLETENKIKLLELFKGAKKHHEMECLVCGHQWIATPISKKQTYKKYGVGGCPNCTDRRRDKKYEQVRQERLDYLASQGVEILTPGYKGKLRLDYSGDLKDEKIQVYNNICGHTFEVTPLNLIQSNVVCSVCGKKQRSNKLTQNSLERSTKWKETATEWQTYKSEVCSLTEQNYKKYKDQINPDDLPRGKAGVEGAYQLDHIISKRFCFENNIPVEVCADVENLQMLDWLNNIKHRNNFKGIIPVIFEQYIDKDSSQLFVTLLK